MTNSRTTPGPSGAPPRGAGHPVLARVLAAWHQEGWERKQGRASTADDLVVPSRRREHRRDPVVHAQLLEDLELLGLRGRRVHDSRRTFISLALADGADRDKLAWVTHGPKGDIVSLHTTRPRESLCTEVAKLKVELRPPSTPPSGGALPSNEAQQLQSRAANKKAPESFDSEASCGVPRAGFEPCPRGWKNLKQDAPLPTIPLILLGFFIPSRPTLSHVVPPDSAPEGHIRGTWTRPQSPVLLTVPRRRALQGRGAYGPGSGPLPRHLAGSHLRVLRTWQATSTMGVERRPSAPRM
ncbi:integrase family protein [Melittangium boletus DSM 14713]|uniref:Integrase family protein n=1 Tax=Melittangium boletus DSM 14713 TaxID=1294270 RepID=A0A286NV17_9BACT|nr:integrase family protein [Melittangium boletus DSM 14713]